MAILLRYVTDVNVSYMVFSYLRQSNGYILRLLSYYRKVSQPIRQPEGS